MYKLLRLVFTLVALVALAGFGYSFYDFYMNKDAYMAHDDRPAFEKKMPPAPAPKPGHLKDWTAYKSMYSANVIGYVKPEVTGTTGGGPVKPKARISASDLRVAAINLSTDPEWSTAWIEPSAAGPTSANPQETPGDLYRVGDKFTIPKEPNLKLEVLSINADYEVELAVEGQEEALVVEMTEFEVLTGNIQSVNSQGRPINGGIGASGPVRPEVKITVESTSEPGTFDIGTDDLDELANMADDDIAAAVKLGPERDADGNIRGLRVNTLRKGSLFERMGVRIDDIVLAVNGEPATDRAELSRWLRKQVDTRVFRATIERRGGIRTITYRVPDLRR